MNMKMLTLAIMLLACVPIGAATPDEKPAGSGVAPRSCIMRIACDPATLELHHDSVLRLVTTVCDKVYADYTDQASVPDRWENVLQLDWLGPPDDEQGVDGVLIAIAHVPWDAVGMDAPRTGFWQALAAEAQIVLQQASGLGVERLQAQLDEADGVMKASLAEMRKLQDRYRQMCDQAEMSDLSMDGVVNALRELEERREEDALEVASMGARKEAIVAQIAEIGERAATAEDPLVAEMEAIVAGLEGRVKRAQALVDANQATGDEILKAREQLLQARLRLMERQEVRQHRAGGAQLEQLNAQLADVSISAHEAESRLEWVTQRLAALRENEVRTLAHEYEREIALRLPLLEGQAREAQMRILDLKENLQSHRLPTVTLLGSQ